MYICILIILRRGTRNTNEIKADLENIEKAPKGRINKLKATAQHLSKRTLRVGCCRYWKSETYRKQERGLSQWLCQSTKELWANVTSRCPNLLKIGPYTELSMVITWTLFAAMSICPLHSGQISLLMGGVRYFCLSYILKIRLSW